MHWNGSSWTQVTSPQPAISPPVNVLAKVAATSAKNAWAVGYYAIGTSYQTFVARWNGTSWRQAISPDPGGPQGTSMLEDIAATSASNAWAVGLFGNTTGGGSLVLHRDGTAWAQVPSP